MKSITKRRLKPRSIGRNTLHKRRHSNRRWGAGQNKSRKKRMIGGVSNRRNGGVNLSNMFKRSSGWNCVCKTISQDPYSKSATDDSNTVQSSNEYTEFKPPAPTSNPPYNRRVRVAESDIAESDIKDATIKKKYLINDDFELVKAYGAHTIRINTQRQHDALPSHLENKQFITKINDTDIRVGSLTEFHQLLEDNKFYDKPVVLTVERGSAGGSGDKQFKVLVNLKRDIPRQGSVGGGKKTTYRRKKHVTQRKINTKRINVMVGGVVLHKKVTCKCSKTIKGNVKPEKGVSEGDDEGVEM